MNDRNITIGMSLSILSGRAASAIVVMLFLLLSSVHGVGSSPGLNSTVTRVIEAAPNTVWMIYPDANVSHPKPSGVGYPNSSSYGVYLYTMAVILGVEKNQQRQTADTDPTLFDRTTGAPVLSNATFVVTAPPALEAQLAYYELNRIAPVYLSSNSTSLFWVSANGTVIPQTVTPQSSNSSSTDLFLLEVFYDLNSNYIFATYGLTPKGAMAAAVFYRTIRQVSTFTDSWYIYRWTDLNRNSIPDASDNYTLIASPSTPPTRTSTLTTTVSSSTTATFLTMNTSRTQTSKLTSTIGSPTLVITQTNPVPEYPQSTTGSWALITFVIIAALFALKGRNRHPGDGSAG